jgi:lysozyme family protein
MTASNFPASLKLVLQSEGGNDDDPADHGGRTSRGITQREYNAWCIEKGLPLQDVWMAPQEHIDAIYHDEYWVPSFCDTMPIGLDYLFFNNAVLEGLHEATILLQRSLGVVEDGRIGSVTRQAIATTNSTAAIMKFSTVEADFYKSLNQPRFIKGWLKRVAFSQQNALNMQGILTP